jgi:hypothetical protein
MQPSPCLATHCGPSTSGSAPGTSCPGSGSGGDLNFDLFDEGSKGADGKAQDPAVAAAAAAKEAARVAQIEKTGKVRRAMLVTHQALGFTTLAVMAATLAVGQVNYQARYNGFHNGNDYDRFAARSLGFGNQQHAAVRDARGAGLGGTESLPEADPARHRDDSQSGDVAGNGGHGDAD